jgi:hypothetical protein
VSIRVDRFWGSLAGGFPQVDSCCPPARLRAAAVRKVPVWTAQQLLLLVTMPCTPQSTSSPPPPDLRMVACRCMQETAL